MDIKVSDLSSNKKEILPGKTTTTGMFRSSEIDLKIKANEEAYHGYGRMWAEKHGWRLATSLLDALNARSSGGKVLSYREADILARGKINPDLLKDFLVPEKSESGSVRITIDNAVIEGSDEISLMAEDVTIGLPDNIYNIRSMYNRGVDYMKNHIQNADENAKQRAINGMKRLETILAQCSLEPWPEERAAGFHKELCKPEFMTLEQFDVAYQRHSRFVQSFKV